LSLQNYFHHSASISSTSAPVVDQKVDMHNNYQVDRAGEIRRIIRAEGQKTLVGAVGLITQPDRACKIVQNADEAEAVLAESMLSGSQIMADAILLGRQFLRE
jgi:hypothetical protein